MLAWVSLVVIGAGTPASIAATDSYRAVEVGSGVAEWVQAAGPQDRLRILVLHDGSLDARLRLGESTPEWVAFMDALPIAWMDASPSLIRDLLRDPHVRAVEHDAPLRAAMDTAAQATRVREVQDGAIEIRPGSARGPPDGVPPEQVHAQGPVDRRVAFDGTGVGIAIVDSGFDCLHPDLRGACVPGRNLVCASPEVNPGLCFDQGVPNTDWLGHGTHVAGIAVGDGSASAGRFLGVAPGASLYGYGVPGVTSGGVLAAFDHLLTHPSEPGFPPIRIVSLSLEPGEENGAVFAAGLRALSQASLVVTIAAGNAVPGFEPIVNPLCRVYSEDGAPLPGLLCVGGYNDLGTGSSEASLWSGTQFGIASDPRSWPDVVAPAYAVVSSLVGFCSGFQRVWSTNSSWTLLYEECTGTSMAAPHAAGVAALVLEAETGLTGGQVEDLLKATAHGFVNMAPYPNRYAGYGLVDARAAVESALGLEPSPMTPALRMNANPQGILESLGSRPCAAGSCGPRIWPVDQIHSGFVNAATRGIEGFRNPAPDDVILPGAGGVDLVARMTREYLDLGNFGATVHADVRFEKSGVNQTVQLSHGAPGSAVFSAGPLAYDAARDGNAVVTWRFDRQGDAMADPLTDFDRTTVYRPFGPN